MALNLLSQVNILHAAQTLQLDMRNRLPDVFQSSGSRNWQVLVEKKGQAARSMRSNATAELI